MMSNWTSEQEDILKTFAEKSACYRLLNYESYISYKSVDTKFALPIIFLSTIAGSLSLSSNNFPIYKDYIQFGCSVITVLVGILGTLQRFLNTSELTSQFYTSSIEFGRLSREISIVLTLPRDDRPVPGAKYLETCSTEYNRLLDSAPAPSKTILTAFEKKYKNSQMAKPDLISLTPVSISKKIQTNAKQVMTNGSSKQKHESKKELDELRQSGVVSRKSSFNNVLAELPIIDDDEDIEMGETSHTKRLV